ncbi:MAG TPA: hypothetical protein VHV28_03540 [Solirubrobacteraceae bacterium]|nr:hypothetical protein [Solirubrobacteraceae bacterium]
MSADAQSRRVYYSKARLTWYLVAAAFVVFIAAIAIPNASGTGNAIIAIVVACIVVAGLLRWAACRVIAEDELTVRNPMRTYRIAWSDIERIYHDGYSYGTIGTLGTIVAFKLKEGRVVRASALITYVQSPRRSARRYSDTVIDELLTRTQDAAPGILHPPARLP